jgi:hypothetical protein
MASTSKPVRKLMKKGVEYKDLPGTHKGKHASPTGATKKTKRLESKILKETSKHIKSPAGKKRVAEIEAAHKNPEVNKKANELHKKLPKSRKKTSYINNWR